jgi:hypothetical protein
MVISMAVLHPVPASAHNHTQAAVEFEQLPAEIFRQAGFRVGRQAKVAGSPADLVAQHRGEKYILEFLSFHGTEEKTRLR